MGGVGLEIELRDSDKELSWFSSCEELHGIDATLTRVSRFVQDSLKGLQLVLADADRIMWHPLWNWD